MKATAHTFIYSTSPAPAAAAADKALEIAGREPERRIRLWKNTDCLSTGLNQLGLNTGSSVTSIIPAQALDKADIFAAPVIFPACPKTSPRIRFTVTSNRTLSDIDENIETLDGHL